MLLVHRIEIVLLITCLLFAGSSIEAGCENLQGTRKSKPPKSMRQNTDHRKTRLEVTDSLCKLLLDSRVGHGMKARTSELSTATSVTCIERPEFETGDSVMYLQLGYSDELRFTVMYSFEYSIRLRSLYYFNTETAERVEFEAWIRQLYK